jgi:hypothetical protein
MLLAQFLIHWLLVDSAILEFPYLYSLASQLIDQKLRHCSYLWYSLSYTMKSGVPQGSTPGPFLLNMLVNYIFASLHNSSYELFDNDINIRVGRRIKNIEDFKHLNCDIDAIET